MEFFLEHIARSLYSEFGENLDSHCLVFPGRRAGLFFLKYLSKQINRPVWTPGIVTINDLFHSFSGLRPAENELLLFELYRVYRSVKKSQETFEDFFYWGDMLLNDFDDIDKYLADPSKLLRNVADIKKIDQQFGGLTAEQAEAVKRFWVNFDPERLTSEKNGFISIWSVLVDLYTAFRESLKAKNIAYEGMIFRDVAESESWKGNPALKWEMLHFIGFNALNECEKSLMLSLKKEGRARFYWDYDESYISETKLNSAGFFLRKNIRIFGNDMPDEWSYQTLLSGNQRNNRRRVIDTSSDIAQVKLVPELVGELPALTPENSHETAIILSDENLLLPLLSSLPENIPEINLTMGFPLIRTPIYSFVRNILDLQRSTRVSDGMTLFSFVNTAAVLKDPMMVSVLEDSDNDILREIIKKNMTWIPGECFTGSRLLSGVFIKAATPELFREYLISVLHLILTDDEDEKQDDINFLYQKGIRNEFIYRVILLINRLDDSIRKTGISISVESWMRILERLLRSQSIPFSGEPLSGLQIMGILETRALDFRNLIILSVNEGVLPSGTTASSFIPYNLREAFGLPSINHQESVYAYHFYRLLHRAENVTFIYNSNPDGLRTGEMSRFLQQMKYDPDLKPGYLNLSFEIRNRVSIAEFLERTEEHQKQLLSRFRADDRNRYLSPSAINTWLNCRMKFYYRYVCGLKEPERSPGEMDPALLGTLLHRTMKSIYQDYTGSIVDSRKAGSALACSETLLMHIKDSIRDLFGQESYTSIADNELIINEVLKVYIRRILEADKLLAPFRIIDLETPVRFLLTIGEDRNKFRILAGGDIDRVDEKDGITRIVDYKTGTISDSIESIGCLFADDRKKDHDGWLQTLLYCEGYISSKPESRLRPSVYKVKKISLSDNSDMLRIGKGKNETDAVTDYYSIRDEFMADLTETVNIIFNIDEPFRMTVDAWAKCNYCPYRSLCLR